jgi:hypothetical protein
MLSAFLAFRSRCSARRTRQRRTNHLGALRRSGASSAAAAANTAADGTDYVPAICRSNAATSVASLATTNATSAKTAIRPRVTTPEYHRGHRQTGPRASRPISREERVRRPGGELFPLFAAWLAGEEFRVTEGHAHRGVGGALSAADPVAAVQDVHPVHAPPDSKRPPIRSWAAACFGTATALRSSRGRGRGSRR